jgi:hypothetical protein
MADTRTHQTLSAPGAYAPHAKENHFGCCNPLHGFIAHEQSRPFQYFLFTYHLSLHKDSAAKLQRKRQNSK